MRSGTKWQRSSPRRGNDRILDRSLRCRRLRGTALCCPRWSACSAARTRRNPRTSESSPSTSRRSVRRGETCPHVVIRICTVSKWDIRVHGSSSCPASPAPSNRRARRSARAGRRNVRASPGRALGLRRQPGHIPDVSGYVYGVLCIYEVEDEQSIGLQHTADQFALFGAFAAQKHALFAVAVPKSIRATAAGVLKGVEVEAVIVPL
jgi:hypothetical protein